MPSTEHPPNKVKIDKRVKAIPIEERIPPELIIGKTYYTASYRWVYRCTLIAVDDHNKKAIVKIASPRIFPCPRIGKGVKVVIEHVTIHIDELGLTPLHAMQ